MDRDRRSLFLGIASVPLAVIAPKLLASPQEPGPVADPMLAYLAAETARNCRGAVQAGRSRAQYVRAAGVNIETLACYMRSRAGMPEIEARLRNRLHDEGTDPLALQARENWPRVASELARDYGVTPPADLDHATLTTALQMYQRHGLPNFHAVRRMLEKHADAIDFSEGRTGAPVAAQTPGNDFGPAGWNAGIGDPSGVSCYELGVLLGVAAILELIPDFSGIMRPIMAVLGLAIAIFCNPLNS